MITLQRNTMIDGGWMSPAATVALPEPPRQAFDHVRRTGELVQSGRRDVMWLEDVYAFVDKGKKRKAIAVLFREMDRILSDSDYELCDSILSSTLDLSRLNVSLWIAVLSITLPASSKLKMRPKLVERIRTKLKQEVPDRAERLLKGLVPEE